MRNLAGNLLIAVPELGDINFFRSVVLMFQHNNEGAAGLILNRKMQVALTDVASEILDESSNCREPLYLGGPVDGPLMALHTSLALAEMQVVPGVFFSMQRENLRRLLQQTNHVYRVFTGYAGWDAKQLENEVSVGGWITMTAERDHVFGDPDELWKQVCEKFGSEIMFASSGSRRPPAAPGLN